MKEIHPDGHWKRRNKKIISHGVCILLALWDSLWAGVGLSIGWFPFIFISSATLLGSFRNRSIRHINTRSKWKWMQPRDVSWDLYQGLVTPSLCTLAEQFHFERTATSMSMSESVVTALIGLRIPRELCSFPETSPPHPKRWDNKTISCQFIFCPGPLWIYFQGISISLSLLFSPLYHVVAPIFDLARVFFF